MKLAFISMMDTSPWGGSEALWSATALKAIDAGCEVAFSTFRWPETPSAVAGLEARGATWLPWSVPAREGTAKRWFRGIARRIPAWQPHLFRQASSFKPIFDFRPDVVCINQGGTYDILLHTELREFLRMAGVPYVVLCRFNSDATTLGAADRETASAFFRQASWTGFVAERNLRSAERQMATRLPNAQVIQSPIDTSRFRAAPWPSDGVARFASVARLQAAYKGQDLLLECLGSPEWKERDWSLQFFGDGADRPWLEELVRHYGIDGKVHFCGHVHDVPAVWRENHLLVQPSRAEGTPQSLIQAMLCGRPSLVTDVGGCTEWVTDTRTGFVAEAAKGPSLARALERAWRARADWETIGRAANQTALAKLQTSPELSLLGVLEECHQGAPTTPR